MKPFVFSCISPHGGEIIPELAGHNPERMALSRSSLQTLGQQMREEAPDTIIYLTPHGLRSANAFSISDSERMQGVVEEKGASFAADARVDRELARAIADEARRADLPVSQLNFATAAGPLSCLPLDWGVIVPLRFMPQVPIVVITTCYDLPMDSHQRLGECVARIAAASDKRIGLVASCDWSHTHAAEGPYGFDPAAAILDRQVVESVSCNDLEALANFETSLVDAARVDGIWQALVLAGALPGAQRDVEFLSYEAPTYFGLLCAAVHGR